MSTHSMNRRLLWKETRQVLPLAFSVIGIAIVFTIWPWFLGHRIEIAAFNVTLTFPPILFAYGVGSVLVSREKETKSIQWLVSLPVPATYLVRHQFLVALLGVCALWLVWLFQFLSQSILNAGLRISPSWSSEFSCFALLNVYILVCSFTVAWISRTPILGLFSVLPLSVLPYLCALGATCFNNDARAVMYTDITPPVWLISLMLLVGIGTVGTFGYRVAISNLAGRPSYSHSATQFTRNNRLSFITETVLDFFRGDSRKTRRAPSAVGSLFWQFRVQNQGIVLAIVAGCALCMPIASQAVLGYRGYSVNNAFVISMSVGMVWCALCWMALVAFHGDQVNSRIRFVAEQGVSPTLVWVTRQIVPLAFLVVYALVWIYCLPPSNDEWFRRGLRILSSRPAVSDILVSCAIVYAVSQWLGQVVRSAAIAAIVAPFAAYFVLLYASFCEKFLVSPWIVVSCGLVLVPMLATWWMTPRWMDGRVGWGYWIQHSAFLLFMLVIPFVVYAQWKVLSL